MNQCWNIVNLTHRNNFLWNITRNSFSALQTLCEGNSPVTGEFSSQRPVTRSFDVFFDLHLNNDWTNHRDASDLRRHRAHYDVTVMRKGLWTLTPSRNGRHFADIFKCNFLNEKCCILILRILSIISQRWFSSLLTHIGFIRSRWVEPIFR